VSVAVPPGGPESASIVDLAHDGRGVARIDGKTVFVADALPGERVRIRRVSRHRAFDEARLEAIDEASPRRVEPRCRHFGVCGGCALQHLEPAAQLAAKQTQLLETLARIGEVRPQEVLEPLSGPAWGYRRRARLGVRWVQRKGRVVVGFRERRSALLADLESCAVLAPPLGELIRPLADLIGALSIRDRLPQIEAAVADDATVLVLRHLEPLLAEDLAHLRAFEARHAVRLYLQPRGYETVAPLPGEEPVALYYRLPDFHVRLRFEPIDFVQVNAPLNERLVERAVELLAAEPGHRVADLFCGLGNFSLPLARSAGRVVGVEGDAGLLERARVNARENGLNNLEFHVADLMQAASLHAWAGSRFDRILLDPPRAGARAVLPLVGSLGGERLVYISCHPGSLARDAGTLVHQLGYRLAAAGVVDMFPHTAHVESMAVFVRGD